MDDVNNPFLSLMQAQAAGRYGSGWLGLLGYIDRKRAAGDQATMLDQVNQHIQDSMTNGSTWQQAAADAFKTYPTFMLEHPEVWQSMGHMRAALQPREVSPNASLMTDQGQVIGTAPPGSTQGDISYHQGEADQPDYFAVTQPNGTKSVHPIQEKFTGYHTSDGRFFRMNNKTGAVDDLSDQVGSTAGDAFTRELDVAAKEIHDSLVAGGMQEPQAQQQVEQWRMKMRQDRLTRLSTQSLNPVAQILGGMMPAGGGGTPAAVPGTPPANPGVPQIAYDKTGKPVSNVPGKGWVYQDGTPYTPPAQ